MESVLHANGNQKKARLATFMSERIDWEGHKSSNQKDYITIVNIYSTKIEAPQYKRQIIRAIKGKLNSNTVILEDFNTPLSSMNRSSMNPSVNYGLWVIMTCWFKFTSCNRCTPLLGFV